MSHTFKSLASRVGTSATLILLTLFVATSQPVSTAPQAPAPPAGTAVVAVPWFGQESQPHQVYAGGKLMLQAVFGLPNGTTVPATSATWDPGDGTATVTVSAANPRAIEREHTYPAGAAEGQPYTATVTVTHASGQVFTDTFKVVIKANTRETKVNMAIDKGLWALHKAMTFETSDGLPSGFWSETNNYPMAATASSVQAFQINGHRESHDPTKDPYVNNAARGIRYILSASHSFLAQTSVALQGGQNPDGSVPANGYGLGVNSGGHASYLGGQIIDALVSSGTPAKTAETGNVTFVRNRTYSAIVQDMLDGYSHGMADTTGGWWYSLESFGGNWNANDTSASHWWAIGVIAAENWGLDAPAWVKTKNRDVGIPLMQNATTGRFGYTNNQNPLWDSGFNVTPAGMIMMTADDMSQTHSRFVAAANFMNTNFNSTIGNYYAMYQLTKAMRTALDNSGNTAPITLLAGTRDWYAAYADHLIANQNVTSGIFTRTVGQAPINGNLAHSWAIIMLSPSLFELPPTAACSVDASVVCQAGAVGGCNPNNGDIYATVNFSGAASTPGDNAIATYVWNFQDSTPNANGVTAAHQFNSVGTFNVSLTVTDTAGASSTVSCPVRVTATAVPPVASAGGPYNVCQNRPASVILDGSGSIGRGSNIVLYQWDWTNPINFTPANSTAAVTDQTAFFAGLAPGAYDVGLRVTDDTPANEGGPFTSADSFTTVTVRTANDPFCNAPPVATNNSYTTQKNVAVSGNVTTDVIADSDQDGDTFSASVVTGPAVGTLALAPSGAFTYTPPTGFDGTVTFTYRQTDQFGGQSLPATVTIVVLPNVAPVAQPDSAGTFSGTPVTVVVLTNDSDADAGQTLTVTGTSGGPANGTATVNGNGTITYTPNLGFAGIDTFTYSISDGNGGTASALVTITVTKRLATVTAGSDTKVYGSADPTLTPTSSGFLPADGISVTQTPRDAGEDVGSYPTHASAAGATLANYDVTYTDGTLVVTIADSTTTVTCTPSVTYTGSPFEVCTANVTGAGALNQAVTPVTYTNNTDVGTAGASATYAGDPNHTGSTGTSSFEITPAPTTTVVTCTPSVMYTGSPFEVCTANVTGAGALNQAVTPVTYTNNTDVGTAGASATYTGDANHSASTGTATFAITPAPTTTVVTCTPSVVYNGSAQEVCTANVTGAGGLNAAVTPVTYTDNTNVGTATASATYGGDANHSASSDSETFTITQAPTSTAIAAPTVTYMANGVVTVSVSSTAGTVLGTVTLTVDGGAPLTGTLSGGSATFTLTAPNAGDHALVASYAAQGNFSASSATGNLHVNPSPTATTLTTSATPQLAGTAVTFTATVVSVAPGSGTPNGVVTFKEGATVLGTGTLNASGVATFTTTTLSNGPHTITAVYNGVSNYLTSTSNTVSKLIFGLAAGGGTFVIGDNNATLNNQVMFWGAQWDKNNSMTGGGPNNSFKGFAISPAVPVVGQTFTSAPGNSAPPPSGVPQYIGIIVTSKVTKSGSTITGTIVKLVVVKVDAGYQGNPGHAGTGTVVAFVQ